MIQITVIFFCIVSLSNFSSLFSTHLTITSFDYKTRFTEALENAEEKQASNLLAKIYKKKGTKKVEEVLFYALSKFYIYPFHDETYITTLIALRQFQDYIQNNQQEISDYFLAPYRPTSVRGTLLDIAKKRSYSTEMMQKLYALQPVAPITTDAQQFLKILESKSCKTSLTKAS